MLSGTGCCCCCYVKVRHPGAKAAVTNHEHPLRHVSGNASSEWFCDECDNTILGSQQQHMRMRCGECEDHDMCKPCYLRGCQHEHALKAVSYTHDGRWFCDECRNYCNGKRFRCGMNCASVLWQLNFSHRCYTCDDYDMCNPCVLR